MAASLDRHVVHKALHETVTILGVDWRVFFLALMAGAAIFNVAYSLLGGLLVTVVTLVFARAMTRRDPKAFDILFATVRQRARYDACRVDADDVPSWSAPRWIP